MTSPSDAASTTTAIAGRKRRIRPRRRPPTARALTILAQLAVFGPTSSAAIVVPCGTSGARPVTGAAAFRHGVGGRAAAAPGGGIDAVPPIVGSNSRRSSRFSGRTVAAAGAATSLTTSALPSTPSALLTLAISSLAGTVVDRRAGGGLGTIASLLVAAAMSNVGLAPASHPLYDLCWTKLLPGSLALILLSGSASGGDVGSNNGDGSISRSEGDEAAELGDHAEAVDAPIRDAVRAVSVPFLIGSLGSIVGCTLAFLACILLSRTAHHSSNVWALPPIDAAVAAGCLCSSYIGGSVNFFAAARILATNVKDDAALDVGSLMGSMAAADLLVMALYFAGMAGAVRSGWLRRLFPGRDDGDGDGDGDGIEMQGNNDASNERPGNLSAGAVASSDEPPPKSLDPIPGQKRRRAVAIIVASSLAWGIVSVSTKFEDAVASSPKFGVPGMGCAAIAVLGTAVGWSLRRLRTVHVPNSGGSDGEGSSDRRNVLQRRVTFPPSWLPTEIDAVCPALSGLCFNLLFAAIGTSANVADALRHGPASVLFATFALAVHVLVTLAGSFGVMKLLSQWRLFPLSLEEVMVASNAAIGGPATAAAFAGSLVGGGSGGGSSGRNKQRESGAANSSSTSSRARRRRGLVVAATVWGVVGYAVATGIGVSLSGTLLDFVRGRIP